MERSGLCFGVVLRMSIVSCASQGSLRRDLCLGTICHRGRVCFYPQTLGDNNSQRDIFVTLSEGKFHVKVIGRKQWIEREEGRRNSRSLFTVYLGRTFSNGWDSCERP